MIATDVVAAAAPHYGKTEILATLADIAILASTRYTNIKAMNAGVGKLLVAAGQQFFPRVGGIA